MQRFRITFSENAAGELDLEGKCKNRGLEHIIGETIAGALGLRDPIHFEPTVQEIADIQRVDGQLVCRVAFNDGVFSAAKLQKALGAYMLDDDLTELGVDPAELVKVDELIPAAA